MESKKYHPHLTQPNYTKVRNYLMGHPTASLQEVAEATQCTQPYINFVRECMDEVETSYRETNDLPPKPLTVPKTPQLVTKAHILDQAKSYVTGAREVEHGDTLDNFSRIAEYWSTHLNTKVTPTDVGVMMTLLKVARTHSNPINLDNYVDAAGYMACSSSLLDADKSVTSNTELQHVTSPTTANAFAVLPTPRKSYIYPDMPNLKV